MCNFILCNIYSQSSQYIIHLEISLMSCPDGPQGSSLVASLTFDSTSV